MSRKNRENRERVNRPLSRQDDDDPRAPRDAARPRRAAGAHYRLPGTGRRQLGQHSRRAESRRQNSGQVAQ